MEIHQIRHACFLLFFVLAGRGHAQESFGTRYNISHITMENGLLHDYIDHIHKDSHGFLWVATNGGGLSRYDGYEFVHYNLNTPNAKLRSNFINSCCEDGFGRLWITSSEGIDLLDLSSGKIVTPPDDPRNPSSHIFRQAASNAMKDSKGNIWVYSNHTVTKITFDQKGNIAKCYRLLPASPGHPTIVIDDIDADGDVWVAIGNKISKIHASDGELYALPVSQELQFEDDLRIRALCKKENEIWIGAEQGLIRYDRNEDTVKRYVYDGTPRSLTQNYVTHLAVNAEKQLMASTLRGLNIYNPATDDFEQFMLTPQNRTNNLSSNFIDCILVDGNIIWIGTETGGLNKIIPKSLNARNYIHSEHNPHSLSPNPVNALFEDENETLWVGTVEGGLNKMAKGSDKFVHYTQQNSGLSHNSVSAIVKDPHNKLWVGTWGHGITVFDPERAGMPVERYLASWYPPGFPMNFVGSLCYDPINKLMWVGTGWGIYYYDYAADYMYSPFQDEDIANQIHSPLGAVIDQYGQLWMGCSDGIFVFDLHTRKEDKFDYTHLSYKLDDPESRLGEKISSIYLDSDTLLWIGSNGNGLFRHIPKEDGSIGRFVNYNTSHGLISNNVRGIVEDAWKELWISTNNGLSCFDPATLTFTNYKQDDGLVGNQFYWNGAARSRNGLLYFGGIDGLTVIDPVRRNIRPMTDRVALTRLRVMNEVIQPGESYIDSDISQAKTISLHESDKSFSLEFAALNFNSPATATYSYRLLGFDDNWVNVPTSRRFASYTNLPAGKYTFQVKYSIDGTPADDTHATQIQVVVRPFFYKTGWFIASMVVLVICLVVYTYWRRVHTLQKQKEKLHRKVEERTRELKEMSKQVEELTLDKIAFFTNITHEFRTPITLIMGPIERALKLSSNPQVIEQLQFVERNSKYLLSLVNQLMDFRKVESGKMEINKQEGDFMQFATLLLIPFEVFANKRNITINKFFRLATPVFLYDQEALNKVMANLLSNAIKFTPDGGTVTVYIATIRDAKDGQQKLYISVKDTGKGIAEEEINKIFDRFYQSRDNVKYPVEGQSGTGIGLYLCKHIVQLHGGILTARNNRKEGSNFRILLPLESLTPALSKGEGEVESAVPDIPYIIDGSDKDTPTPSPLERAGVRLILVVEDNKDMRSFIRSILIDKYNILEAGNGAEALEVLAAHNVDFIISDLMMPVMDGIEFSKRVKENFAISHIPILMLTAKTSPEARIESYRTGVDSYLLKPFNDELLLARIENILDNRHRHQQKFAMSMSVEALEMEEESNDKKFLNKALTVAKDNYKNPDYDVTEFLKDMGVSKSLMNKKLQHLTGQSTGEFIRNYRLNIAHQLIEKNRTTHNMNISEIAYEVGFNDPKYFTRRFMMRFGVTPSRLLEN